MNFELIVPIGTSMLTGWMPRVDPQLQLPSDWVGARGGAARGGAGPEGRVPDMRAWQPRLKKSLDAGRSCAEIDSLRLWRQKRDGAHVPRITLIVSDTPSAAWVATMLEGLLPDVLDGIAVDKKVVASLSAENMRAGLVELIRVAARAVKDAQRRGNQPAINATPGFKAESALLTLLGAMLGAEIFYLHEHMRDMIVVPVLPLQWDLREDEITWLRRIGEAVDKNVLRDLMSDPYRRLLPFIEFVQAGDDELWGLSALGELVLESSDAGQLESLAEREGDMAFLSSASELGHQPDDAETLVKEVGRKLHFVKAARLIRWQPYGSPGVLLEAPGDRDAGIVRLLLQSRQTGLKMQFLLHTTARNEQQWTTARQLVARHYGRVGLLDDQPEGAQTATPAEGDIDASELDRLHVEHVLVRDLAAARTLSTEVAQARDAERAEADAKLRSLSQKLEHATMKSRSLGDQLRAERQKRADLEIQVADARLELQQLTIAEPQSEAVKEREVPGVAEPPIA